jgi:hypothetical protein
MTFSLVAAERVRFSQTTPSLTSTPGEEFYAELSQK